MRSRWMVCMLVVTALGAATPVAAEQGVTDTEILLGGSNSFSGPLAFTGTQLTRFGVDLYFRVLNDAGGVHGRRIRTIYYDDAYRPQDAVANTRKLVEQDKIFAVIAPQGSPLWWPPSLISNRTRSRCSSRFRARQRRATGSTSSAASC